MSSKFKGRKSQFGSLLSLVLAFTLPQALEEWKNVPHVLETPNPSIYACNIGVHDVLSPSADGGHNVWICEKKKKHARDRDVN